MDIPATLAGKTTPLLFSREKQFLLWTDINKKIYSLIRRRIKMGIYIPISEDKINRTRKGSFERYHRQTQALLGYAEYTGNYDLSCKVLANASNDEVLTSIWNEYRERVYALAQWLRKEKTA